MACEAYCICKCGHSGCACWDGLSMVKLERDSEKETKP